MNAFAKVHRLADVMASVDAVRARAGGYVTNLFADPAKVEGWLARGDLAGLEVAGCVLFLRRDRWFHHLHFCAAGPGALGAALERLPGDAVLSLDLLGSPAQVEALRAVFAPSGFKDYARLTRLALIGGQPGPPPREAVERAAASDVDAILGLLEASFDPLKEQLPSREELEGAVAARRILLVRGGGDLAGLLHFSAQGATATLRYWLVAPGHRDRGIGATLIRAYFHEDPAVRRHLLWVLEDNADALSKYGHYGYAPDGLVDQVMLREPNL